MMPRPMASNVDRRTQGGRISAEWRWQDVQLVAGVDGEDSRHRGRMGMGRDTGGGTTPGAISTVSRRVWAATAAFNAAVMSSYE